MCQNPLGDFTTSQTAGTVMSWGRFAQTYGRFEFRAKFPPTTGEKFASALWMLPEDSPYGSWPNSGEIDVAERFGDRWFDRVFPSVHYAGENFSLSSGYNCVVPTSATEFHTYAVNWTETTMYFYYDDQLCFQHSWTPDAPLVAPQPFDQAFNFVMTQGGASDAPVGATFTTDVDWVRAWK